MYVPKIHAATAAAAVLAAREGQARAFHVNNNNASSSSRLLLRGVPRASAAVHSSSSDRMTATTAAAALPFFCSSSRGNRAGFFPSLLRPTAATLAFCSSSTGWWRSLPRAPSSHRRRQGTAEAVSRRRRGTAAATGTTLLSMKASGQGGEKGESVRNRALGTVVYLLPMLDGLDCGRDVFHAVPMLGSLVHGVLAPALAIWDNVPFMPLVMFIILQVSVRRQDTSRFIRFNVQQAILVDILTVVLGLLGTAAGYVAPEGEQFVTNFAFYCLVGAVAYAVAETARGKMANQIPLISAAAEIQLGPS
ncbi:unnamed protein product [Ectocarpus sp. CCAP 1310/34]|nr:unnamed protein product [Ectocarpus sp. CCAP 1310/34]